MDLLENAVRPYAWGSTTDIPELLGVPPTGEPQAEMWMGAHPGAPSHLERGGRRVPLSDVIEADPERELGAAAVRAYGPRLPFLLKVLAAASPLSLQVHPDLAQAAEGFAAEEADGVPPGAPHRNYQDRNHKPELICALTPFEGLCGFRSAADAARLLDGLDVNGLKPYVDILHASPESEALREVLTAVLTADRDEIAETVAQASAAADSAAAHGAHAANPAYAAYSAYASIARHYPGDPGVIAAMLLNHVRLEPGEALYLGAGVPHAYLDGMGVEIMANSDNVLRCGLTPKHVDVPELLRIVRFESGEPEILRPETESGEEVYATPAREFQLSRLLLAADGQPQALGGRTPRVLLCTEGRVTLRNTEDGAELTLERGQSAYAGAGERLEVRGDGTIFRATVAT